jgi:antirestriction protein
MTNYINLTKAEQTDEVIAAREAIDEGCPLAQRFICGYSQEFNLDGYTEALYALDGNPAAAMVAWLSTGCSVDSFSDHYQGEWADEVSFAENLVDECGMLESMPKNLRYYFDYAAFSRDLFINDYIYLDGFVVSN